MTNNHDATTWLTPAAYQKLQDELEQLTTVGRREIEERIAEARSHGDIRENAEYDVAKNDQGMMEARIRKIQGILETAHVEQVEDSGAVAVGTIATVRDTDGDELEIFVAPTENKHPGLVLASPDSPLGGALLGAAPGDDVSYEAPGGTFTYRVLSVRVYEG